LRAVQPLPVKLVCFTPFAIEESHSKQVSFSRCQAKGTAESKTFVTFYIV
jgi:hypothetical protein